MAMFRWLSRYVKKIEVFGVGIELREIPAEQAKALELLTVEARPQAAQSGAGQGESVSVTAEPIVQRQDYICVLGTTPSSRRSPREMDLMAEGEEIQLHIHQPGGSQAKMWVERKALEEAFASWDPASGEISVQARTARKEGQVLFVFDDSVEVEVQAGWWIWVGKQNLKAALAELGLRAPW